MDWRSYLSELGPTISLREPASSEAVLELRSDLGHGLSPELESLLVQSNGVLGEYDLDLVWPTSRIKSDNQLFRANADFRELYMPFDSLLFFGDAGNGDQFAFPVLAGQVRRSDVFVWNHEDDSRTWIASSLHQFLEWWVSAKIKV